MSRSHTTKPAATSRRRSLDRKGAAHRPAAAHKSEAIRRESYEASKLLSSDGGVLILDAITSKIVATAFGAEGSGETRERRAALLAEAPGLLDSLIETTEILRAIYRGEGHSVAGRICDAIDLSQARIHAATKRPGVPAAIGGGK